MDPQQIPPSRGDFPQSEAISKSVYGVPLRGQSTQVVLVQPAYSGFRRWFSWLGWIAFFFCLISLVGLSTAYKDYFDSSHNVMETFESGSKQLSADKVAIIQVSGIITDGDGFVRNQIDRIRDDNKVKAVVVRIDSPGGTITGSDYIYQHLKKLREDRKLPMVVSMGSVAASGGYYIAMAVGDQEKSIFAEQTTTTGSIGVIIPHYDISGLMEKLDIKDDSLATHPRKKMLSMTRSFTDDDRTVLTDYLNSAFDRFKVVVREGRPAFRANEALLDELATGEIFAAPKAKEKGLVDELGFLESAVERAIELAGLESDDVRVVRYKQQLNLAEILGLGVAKSQSTPWNLAGMLDLATPRAYYLWTSMPALVSSSRSR
jgi:protease-4